MTLGKWGRAALAGVALAVAGAAQAQTDATVILRSFDGFTQIRGELTDFDGTTYTLTTGIGTIRIPALQVNCEGEACPKHTLFGAEFAVAGSSTIGADLMPALIQGYADKLGADLVREVGAGDSQSTLRIMHEDGREMAAIELDVTGSTAAFDELAANTAAIGMASRRARDADVEKLLAAGYSEPRDSAREHVLALDGLVIVVHPDNRIRSLSLQNLSDIFSGQVRNWSELGGPDLPITVYAREDGSGTLDSFVALVLAPAGAQLAPAAQRLESNVALSDAVASDRGGIGFTGYASVRAAKPLGVRQACGILSTPSIFAMKTEEYPLSRRLYLYETDAQKPAHASQLVSFALSPEAQTLIQEAGFVDTAPEAASLHDMGGRIVYSLTTDDEFSIGAMREMLTELQNAERLSTTFRFTPGSSQLDPLSQREAASLAERLVAGAYEGKEVLLVGYTDAIGQFELNRELAQRRAEVVMDALRLSTRPGAIDALPISTRGYGELMPVGCNESFSGRLANRRVEVWMRDIVTQ